MGHFALRENTTGNGNTVNGNAAGLQSFTGAFNTVMGGATAQGIIAGQGHTAIGQSALQFNTDSIATVGAITPGSGYTDGTYTNVVLVQTNHNVYSTGGITADLTVVGGQVTSVTIVSGLGVRSSTILGINAATAPAGLLTGSGFSIPVTSVNVVNNNTALGRQAGRFNYTGSNNTFIGASAGQNATGSSNVFLGYQAGLNETNSNRLYISNGSTTTPLIKGTFDPAGGSAGNLTINGDLIIKSKTPASATDTGTAGEIAWDSSYFYVCTATNTWTRIALAW
jgi:hypothetical protein